MTGLGSLVYGHWFKMTVTRLGSLVWVPGVKGLGSLVWVQGIMVIGSLVWVQEVTGVVLQLLV